MILYERVSNWNAARYERVYNHELAASLINEELNEYYDQDPVAQLDALCDITFVAMGITWKLDWEHNEQDITDAVELAHRLGNAGLEPIYALHALVAAWEEGEVEVLIFTMAAVSICQQQAEGALGYTADEFERALHAVCDSNDTKTITKTAADTKANIDKGSFYVPPTVALTKIHQEKLDRLAKVTNS